MCLILDLLECLELGDWVFSFGFFGSFGSFLELGDGVFSFGCFAIVKCCCILEFVLVKENLKAQGTCTIFRTTPNLPHLLRSVLEFWDVDL